MSTNIIKIQENLRSIGIKYIPKSESELLIKFTTEKYRDSSGANDLLMVLHLDENGEYFRLFAPQSFIAAGPYQETFFKALLIVQNKTKLIQFEYDDEDGEIRAIIEFPLEDNIITAKQLHRCIHGMVTLLDEYYSILETCLSTGNLDFEAKDVEDKSSMLGNFLRNFSPEIISEALRKADRKR